MKKLMVFVIIFLLIIQVADIFFVFYKNPHLPKKYKESITFKPLLIIIVMLLIYNNIPWHIINMIRRWWR